MKINKLIASALTAGLGFVAYGTVPVVSNLEMTQAGWGRLVTIKYDLSATAVVTLDVQTNANTSATADDSGWTSIGGVAVSNARGDVWKKVDAGSRTISWRPDQSWPGHDIAAGGARAVVTAWSLNNTPDYMVVDISEGAKPNTQRYYPSVDFLPGSVAGQTGAVTNNPIYKTTMIVMRKIMAKDVIWTMGSAPGEAGRDSVKEASHQVALANNYYIGVFEVTQKQWALLVQGNLQFPSHFTNLECRDMRPVENICFNEIRMAGTDARGNSAVESAEWPVAPYASSFLGLLRARTGIDFDLPSEAEWEFAARAGNGSPKWGDGSIIHAEGTDENLSRLGRYMKNGGYVDGTALPDQGVGPQNGTAVVGSYKPNDWGLYDMHGNVWEWCLDWYKDDISALNGAVNDVESGKRVIRGGAWQYIAPDCRPARRTATTPGTWNLTGQVGLRLTCRAGLD